MNMTDREGISVFYKDEDGTVFQGDLPEGERPEQAVRFGVRAVDARQRSCVCNPFATRAALSSRQGPEAALGCAEGR